MPIKIRSIAIALSIGNVVLAQTTFAQQGASLYLEEVVVVAQRREQSLQDVPLSVSAVDSDALKQAGFSGLHDLGNIVSGVKIGNAQSAQSVSSIRGIASFPFGFGVEASVPFYLDGIYMGAGFDALGDLMDVSQIEVLKGPQGTLFGRNASAGAVNIRTVQPDSERSGSLDLNVGSYDLRSMKLSGNIPLIENTLLARAGYSQTKRDGWQTNVVSGEEDGYELARQSAYAKVLWFISDEMEVEFAADWTDQDDHPGYVSIADTTTTFEPIYLEQALPQSFSSDGQTKYASSSEAFNFNIFGQDFPVAPASHIKPERTRSIGGISGTFVWALDDSSEFKSLTSYRDGERTIATDSDGSNLGIVNTDTVVTTKEINQELRYSVSNQRMDWFVGFNAYYQEREFDFRVNTSGLVTFAQSLPVLGFDPSILTDSLSENIGGKNTTASYAMYGDSIWHLSDRINLTLGLRYSYDDKEFEQYDSDNNTLNGGGVLFPTLAQLENSSEAVLQDTWDNLSGRAVVDYALGDDTLVYASIAQGYKSGGFNTTRTVGLVGGTYIAPSAANEPFNEETNLNFELGLKSTLADGRLRFNASFFAYEYKDLQFLLSDQESPVALTTNAPKVEGHGIDADILFAVTHQLSVTANLAYLNAEYTEDVVDGSGVVRYEAGQKTIFSPEISGIIGVDYAAQIGSMGELRFNASYSYTGDHLQAGLDATSSFDPAASRSDSYSVLNTRMSWLSPEQRWEVALWGRNLTDEFYTTFISSSGAATGGVLANYPAEPRTYGVNVILKL